MTEKDLRQRFVKNFDLPFSVLDSPWFEYFLDLYEEDYKSKTTWEKLQGELGNPGEYLYDYGKARDLVISEIESCPEYKALVSDSEFFEKYKIPGEVTKELYTEGQVGNLFLGIDLKEANYQALKYYDPGIVRPYEKVRDSSLFLSSKYTRQVIFGKLSSRRIVTLERFLMYQISCIISELLPPGTELFSRKTDEIIYTLPEKSGVRWDDIKTQVKRKLGVEVKVEIFRLGQLKLDTVTGYTKDYIIPFKKPSLHCVPKDYFAQMYKYWKGLKVDPYYDLVFTRDDRLAHFDTPLL